MAPKIRWKAENIQIALAEDFDSNQTYIVSVSSEVADLRGNRLDSTVTVAFSTGLQIDTGSIAGRVLASGQPAGGMVIALYKMTAITDTTVYDSIYASYVVTSNQEGSFRFQYLPEGSYRLIAYEDRNQDEHFNPARELFALSDREIDVGGQLPLEQLVLLVTSYDSLAPDILSAVGTKDNLVRIRLSKAVGIGALKEDPSRLLLHNLAEGRTSIIPARGFLESADGETDVLTAYFEDLSGGSYEIELSHDPDLPSLIYDTLHFERVTDMTPPAIVSFEPAERPLFADRVNILLRFSEPLDTAGVKPQTFVLWESEEKPVRLKHEWIGPFAISFRPEELNPGKRYRFDITEFDLADQYGNLLGDSLVSYHFSTLDDDSLGSIGGEVEIGLPSRASNPVVLIFKNTGDNAEFMLPTRTGQFLMQVPPGRYVLCGFIDQDSDGKHSSGSITPFRTAETFAIYSDTIDVRARFETAGTLFEFK